MKFLAIIFAIIGALLIMGSVGVEDVWDTGQMVISILSQFFGGLFFISLSYLIVKKKGLL